MHFRGSFLFNGNVKIINGSLEFPIKVPTQKAKAIFYKDQIYRANLKNFSNPHPKFIIYKNQIYIANFKSFTNQRSDSTSKIFHFVFFRGFFWYTWNIFLFLEFCSKHIWSKIERTKSIKDILMSLKHPRHSESTWTLGGHSETLTYSGTRGLRALEALYLAESH